MTPSEWERIKALNVLFKLFETPAYAIYERPLRSGQLKLAKPYRIWMWEEPRGPGLLPGPLDKRLPKKLSFATCDELEYRCNKMVSDRQMALSDA